MKQRLNANFERLQFIFRSSSVATIWRIKFIIIFLNSCYLCVALQKERWWWKVRQYFYPRFKENSEEEELLHRSLVDVVLAVMDFI